MYLPREPTATARRDLGRVRLNEVHLEIESDAISESAIEGLIKDWIVPMIVEKTISSVIASADSPPHLQNGGFYTYN
jgi:hypothetical protein